MVNFLDPIFAQSLAIDQAHFSRMLASAELRRYPKIHLNRRYAGFPLNRLPARPVPTRMYVWLANVLAERVLILADGNDKFVYVKGKVVIYRRTGL